MFKLSELFVEIKAQDEPFKASIEKLKGSMTAAATSIGAAMKGAFALALPGIGTVISLVSELFSTISEGNPEIEAIGGFFTGMIEPIKAGFAVVTKAIKDYVVGTIDAVKNNKVFNAIVETTGELFTYLQTKIGPIIGLFTNMYNASIEAIKKWYEGLGISKALTDATKTGLEYIAAGFDNLKTAIDQGVHEFWVFKGAAEETLASVSKYLQGVYDDLMNSFGDPAIEALTNWGGAIKTWVLDKIELVGIFVRNWPDFFRIAYLKIVDYLSLIGETLATIPQNATIIGEYISNNFVRYFTDAVTNIQALFSNLGTNLKSIWQAFMDYLKTGKFEVHFEDLMKGMVSSVDKLPDLVAPALDAHLARLEAINKIEQEIGEKVFKKHQDAAKVAAKADDAKKAGAAGGEGFKVESFGIAEFASKIRAGILNKDSDDKVAKQLKASERTAEATEKIAAEIDKPKGAIVK